MTGERWERGVVERIAAAVRHYRKRSGLSTQQLADKCAELGLPIKRPVLSNLETGRRPTVSVPELLVLAKALDVPPVQLVFPLGHANTVEALPGRHVNTWQATQWFTGEESFSLQKQPGSRAFMVEDSDIEAWKSGGNTVDLYREHQRLLDRWADLRQRAMVYRASAAKPTETAPGSLLESSADAYEQQADVLAQQIHAVRQRITDLGLTPPDLGLWAEWLLPTHTGPAEVEL